MSVSPAPSSWRYENGLALWTFQTCERRVTGELPSCPTGPEPLSAWLAERTRRVVRVLAPFASLERLIVTTRSGGEDACVLRGSQGQIQREFDIFAASELGIVSAELTLTLHCLAADGKAFSIRRGAHLFLEPSFDDRGEVIENEDDAGIILRLSLHADIYSPRNPCEQPDNTLLAALNGPLLGDFIARLEATVPCRFEFAYADGYMDLISRRGFALRVPPATGRADQP